MSSPQSLAVGDFDRSGKDDLAADLGFSGLRVRYNNSSAWTLLRPVNPDALIVGNFDGQGAGFGNPNTEDDLAVDFGAEGLWIRYSTSPAWTKVHLTNPWGLAAGDLDGNGTDELIVDFDTGDLWARSNNANWVKLPRRPL